MKQNTFDVHFIVHTSSAYGDDYATFIGSLKYAIVHKPDNWFLS